MTGSAMGAWFLSFAFSMYVAAGLAKLTGSVGDAGAADKVLPPVESLHTYLDLFGKMGYAAVGIGLFLILLSRPLSRLMHGVE
jgi:POT family proton-dependent oligopeptide transporter